MTPKQSYYDELEIDEFWTYAGKKKNKLWPVYAYRRSTGEIIAWVRGKRNPATVNKLRKKITNLGITFNKVYSDGWTSFIKAFKSDNNIIGKVNTVGIEGNNCRSRHRVRRAFRK
ncbi:MAG: IS1 family transposase, partial [Candidatus Electrothrix sp. AUS1_2]|nr:IS1 family transposase [Candidatus Electrothrix sp. AUS1_2]